MGISRNSLSRRRWSLSFWSLSREHMSPVGAPSQTHLELQQHSWRRGPKCTGLQQLMVLAAGQQRAPGTCNQRPRTLCPVCDLCVPATQCLEPCRHPVLRDPISFLQTSVFTLLDLKIEVRWKIGVIVWRVLKALYKVPQTCQILRFISRKQYIWLS